MTPFALACGLRQHLENMLFHAIHAKVTGAHEDLQKLGIKHQLQLARLVRISLPITGWPTLVCQCADRSLPQSAVPQDPFNFWSLVSFDEADYFHLAAALAALKRVDFVDPLDQHGPG